jgi:hypothetical protein
MASKQPVSTRDQARRPVNKSAQVQDFKDDPDLKYPGKEGCPDPALITPGQVMRMQSAFGNQATHRFLAGLRSHIDPEHDEQVTGGIPERLAGPGKSIMREDGASGEEAVEISTVTNYGPAWLEHGIFDWRVGFSTNGHLGWILQEITNTYDARDMGGYDVTPTFAPHYWEAWEVDEVSRVSPNVGADNDYWTRVSRGPNTRGSWSMDAAVYWSTTDPATQGFIPNGVMDAGELLLSTYDDPADPGMLVLSRAASGAWDSTGAAPTHAGTAGP